MEDNDNSVRKLKINNRAAKIACFHSLRYLTDDTLGVFIGKYEKDRIIIEDAYPLFHSRITEPTIQISFDIIQNLIPKDKQILGIYESMIRLEGEKDLHSQIAGKILETISETNAINPIFVKIEEPEAEEEEQENEENDPQNEKIDFQIFQFIRKGASGFNLKQINSCLEESIDLETIQQEYKKGSHRVIIDFDNHFEDPSLDFTNPQIQA